jgi:prophage maintenance system killer protein
LLKCIKDIEPVFLILKKQHRMSSEIKIYKSKDGKTEIKVTLEKETVWLNQYQLEELFQTNRTSINRHISNIYKTRELKKTSTCAKIAQVQKEGSRKVTRQVSFYNLDIIIAVGYRINSKRGTDFRIWANNILKEYLIKGYSINERRLKLENKILKDLQNSVNVLSEVIKSNELTDIESKGLLQIISEYAYALDILDQYDYQKLQISDTSSKETYRLTYTEAIKQIDLVKKNYRNTDLFGREKDNSFRSSISTIYQTFDGQDLYPSIEEKAAHILYFITKNHSFTDGNKRIAALIFLYFLEKNSVLMDNTGNKRIADNALVALTLMIAVSKPEEKDTMIKVIVNLINKKN